METHSGHLILEGSPHRLEFPLQWSAADFAAALPAPSTIGVSPAAVSAAVSARLDPELLVAVGHTDERDVEDEDERALH